MTSVGIAPITCTVQPVPADATIAEAAQMLAEAASTLPMVDADGCVIGVIDSGGLLKALVPPYIESLSHTGFIRQDPAGLLRRAMECGRRPARDVARELPEYLEADASEAHAAELFMHTGILAIPVVDARGALLGMVRRVDLVVALATA